MLKFISNQTFSRALKSIPNPKPLELIATLPINPTTTPQHPTRRVPPRRSLKVNIYRINITNSSPTASTRQKWPPRPTTKRNSAK